MEKDIEKLLQPRVKVTNPYPDSIFTIGEVLIKNIHSDWYFNKSKRSGVPESKVLDCPNIFKPMHWYEDRTPEEMPMYVALSHPDYVYSVQKVKKFWKDMVLTEDWDSFQQIDKFIPATEQDHINYIKLKL